MRHGLLGLAACAVVGACSPSVPKDKAAPQDNVAARGNAAAERLPDAVAILPAAGVVPRLLDEEAPYWFPDRQQVLHADRALPGYLRATGQSASADSFAREGAKQIVANYGKYRRQYFGITRKGRRILYVRGFCDADPPADWRTTEVSVLDGGPCYFFAWYDPAAKRFTFFEANGFA